MPIAVTVGALLIAMVFGVMPARENATKAETRAAQASTEKVADLEARIAALEAALTPAEGEENAAPPTRDEINLIVKGLVNQTGRVSRLQDQVEGIIGGDIASAPDPRVEVEFGLAKRALVNLTRRINGMKDIVETTEALPRDVDQLSLRISNVESAVTQIHRRVRALQANPEAASEEKLDEVVSQLEEALSLLRGDR